jgi:hypothetical protein
MRVQDLIAPAAMAIHSAFNHFFPSPVLDGVHSPRVPPLISSCSMEREGARGLAERPIDARTEVLELIPPKLVVVACRDSTTRSRSASR